jgi:sulfite reductase beta subunit-like hemoprotein
MTTTLSPVETIKADSRGLRGTLVESLADAHTGGLREADQTLLKFHGSYQQDDRDLREERADSKLEPAHSFMIRTRTPGGVVTPTQWLAFDAIARRYGGGSLRLTTRQAIQLHGVIKRELKATLQAINQTLIDTIAACGDVNRNVLVSANPVDSDAHRAVYADAVALSEALLPATRAVRADLSATQVQDRFRAAAAERCRHLRARPGIRRHRRRRRGDRLQRAGRRWPRHHPRRCAHLCARRQRARFRAARAGD